MKAKVSAWKGKQLPEEMKGKIAAGKTITAMGNKLYNIKKELYGLVVKRDLFKCKTCGRYGLLGQSLTVRMINKQGSTMDLKNLGTFCNDC